MAAVKAETLRESLRFAVAGAIHAFRSERNLRIHVALAVIVMGLAVALGVARQNLPCYF